MPGTSTQILSSFAGGSGGVIYDPIGISRERALNTCRINDNRAIVRVKFIERFTSFSHEFKNRLWGESRLRNKLAHLATG